MLGSNSPSQPGCIGFAGPTWHNTMARRVAFDLSFEAFQFKDATEIRGSV
jgi:hypothetical protein